MRDELQEIVDAGWADSIPAWLRAHQEERDAAAVMLAKGTADLLRAEMQAQQSKKIGLTEELPLSRLELVELVKKMMMWSNALAEYTLAKSLWMSTLEPESGFDPEFLNKLLSPPEQSE